MLISLKTNIKFCKTNKFIKLPTNRFGENTPNKDTYIVDGHPIFVDGKEVQPGDFLGKMVWKKLLLTTMLAFILYAQTKGHSSRLMAIWLFAHGKRTSGMSVLKNMVMYIGNNK